MADPNEDGDLLGLNKPAQGVTAVRERLNMRISARGMICDEQGMETNAGLCINTTTMDDVCFGLNAQLHGPSFCRVLADKRLASGGRQVIGVFPTDTRTFRDWSFPRYLLENGERKSLNPVIDDSGNLTAPFKRILRDILRGLCYLCNLGLDIEHINEGIIVVSAGKAFFTEVPIKHEGTFVKQGKQVRKKGQLYDRYGVIALVCSKWSGRLIDENMVDWYRYLNYFDYKRIESVNGPLFWSAHQCFMYISIASHGYNDDEQKETVAEALKTVRFAWKDRVVAGMGKKLIAWKGRFKISMHFHSCCSADSWSTILRLIR